MATPAPDAYMYVPVAVFTTPTIPASTRVYLYYLSMSTQYEWVYVKDASIAALLGISVKALRVYRGRLKDSGVLVSRGTPAGTKGPCFQKHAYRVVHPSCTVAE